MNRPRSDGRAVSRWLVLAGFALGCGNPAPPPSKEGPSAFSYDDDEIDPATLKPAKGQAKAKGRR